MARLFHQANLVPFKPLSPSYLNRRAHCALFFNTPPPLPRLNSAASSDSHINHHQSIKQQYCTRSCVALEETTSDLTVTIHSTSLVVPLEQTERETVFLSNIDRNLNFKASVLIFFSNNPKFPFEKIVADLENACRKILVEYNFLAGRLRWNAYQGRLEIDCNSAGAGFVVASCDRSFQEFGGIDCPNVVKQLFVYKKWNNVSLEDQPLLVIQMTLFPCGGFSLGICYNHVTMDGISCKIFLENLASLLSHNKLLLAPYNNRHLIAARSPPQITFPHPEMLNLDERVLKGTVKPNHAMPLRATFQKLTAKHFQLSLKDINNLKWRARFMDANTTNIAATAFNVVVAHIWRCVAQAKNPNNDPEKLSTILYAVNIRSRVRPRLPSSYAGNAVLTAYSTTTCGEIENTPFSHLVQLVSKGDTRMTDEYVKSIIDWSELHKGCPYGDVLVSSWWNLGGNEIEYPWGTPNWSCPVLSNHGNNAITLLPEAQGKVFQRLHVLVSLPHKEMERFQLLLYQLL